MLKQATDDLEDEDFVYIRYHLDGSLFNLRRLQAHTKTYERLIMDLLFADDAALFAHTQWAFQHSTSCFAESAQLFGLEVSLTKTEVLHQPAPQEEYHAPHISIGETDLKSVQQFTYLGLHRLIKCEDWQADQQQTCKVKLCIWQAVQTCVEEQTPTKQNEDQYLQSRRTDHPPIWLWILGHLPEPLKTLRAIPSTLSPHHPEYTLERLY